MVTKNIQLPVTICFLACFLIGCTAKRGFIEGENSIPMSWATAIANTPEDCVPVDGVYQTFGVGKFKKGDDLTQARLDAALGYVFPSENIPENVRFSLDQEKGSLNIQFGQPINKSFSTSAVCINGWYQVEQRLTNEYLGDGTTLDYLINEIELGKSVDGSLILHLLFDVQSSSFLILKSRDIGESWSRYEEIKSEN